MSFENVIILKKTIHIPSNSETVEIIPSSYGFVMMFEKVPRQRNVLSKISSPEVIESIILYSEHGFAMKFERVGIMRYMISSHGLAMISEEVARQRNVLHKLSSSESIGSICTEHGFAKSFGRVARVRHMTWSYRFVMAFEEVTRQRNDSSL